MSLHPKVLALASAAAIFSTTLTGCDAVDKLPFFGSDDSETSQSSSASTDNAASESSSETSTGKATVEASDTLSSNVSQDASNGESSEGRLVAENQGFQVKGSQRPGEIQMHGDVVFTDWREWVKFRVTGLDPTKSYSVLQCYADAVDAAGDRRFECLRVLDATRYAKLTPTGEDPGNSYKINPDGSVDAEIRLLEDEFTSTRGMKLTVVEFDTEDISRMDYFLAELPVKI